MELERVRKMGVCVLRIREGQENARDVRVEKSSWLLQVVSGEGQRGQRRSTERAMLENAVMKYIKYSNYKFNKKSKKGNQRREGRKRKSRKKASFRFARFRIFIAYFLLQDPLLYSFGTCFIFHLV